jgi:hypothetical protein
MVTISCKGQGGNPEPILSLYLGSEKLGDSSMGAASATFVATAAHHREMLVCQAINSVMDIPEQSSRLLEVLCK